MQCVVIPYGTDNYSYLLVCEKTSQAVIIDPGEAAPVIAAIAEAGCTLKMILCTHHHHDHIGGIPSLLQHFGKLPVFCHESDIRRIPGMPQGMGDGERIVFGECQGTVLHTPGHTRGSICYHFADAFFSGDTLFGAGCGRLFEGTSEEMYASLLHLQTYWVQARNIEKIYFGHEYTITNLCFALKLEPENEMVRLRLQQLQSGRPSLPATVNDEMQTNPFLRSLADGEENPLLSALRSLLGQNISPGVELFAVLRALRDEY